MSALTCFVVLHVFGINMVLALPTGWEVIEGDVNFEVNGSELNITSTSQQAIVNYSSFDVASHETVNFFFNIAHSIILNRVISGNASNIMGSINGAGGNVALVNTAGLNFSDSSQVNVAGFIASTLDINNADFMNGSYVFKHDGQGGLLESNGTINASKFAILSGSAISNTGQINSNTVGLVVGDKITIDLGDNHAIAVHVDEALIHEVDAVADAIRNAGTINAHIIQMETKLAENLYARVVNNTGVIRAASVDNIDGKVTIRGASDTGGALVENTGMIDVASGNIDISGDNITQSGTLIAMGETNRDGGNIDIRATESSRLTAGSITSAKGQGTQSNAGDVIIWSDQNTYFDDGATIDVSGGNVSGDGGFAEVSAVKTVFFNGQAYGGAVDGKAGKILIDPTVIRIQAAGVGGSSTVGQSEVNNSGGESIFSTASFSGFSDVTLEATDDIFVEAQWDLNNITAGHSLTLRAADDISIQNQITTQGGNINLNSNYDFTSVGGPSASGNGDTTITATGSLNSNGGAISLTANTVNIDGNINTSGGLVQIDTLRHTIVKGTVNSAGNDITINTNTDNLGWSTGGSGGSLILDTTGTVFTGNGNLNVSAPDADLRAGSLINTGSGDVNLSIWGPPTGGNQAGINELFFAGTVNTNNFVLNAANEFWIQDTSTFNSNSSMISAAKTYLNKSMTNTQYNSYGISDTGDFRLFAGKTLTPTSDFTFGKKGHIIIEGTLDTQGHNLSLAANTDGLGAHANGSGGSITVSSTGTVLTGNGDLTMTAEAADFQAGSLIDTGTGDTDINIWGLPSGGNQAGIDELFFAGTLNTNNLNLDVANQFWIQETGVLNANSSLSNVYSTYINKSMTDTQYNSYGITNVGELRLLAGKTFTVSSDFTLNKTSNIYLYGTIDSQGNNLAIQTNNLVNIYNGASILTGGGNVTVQNSASLTAYTGASILTGNGTFTAQVGKLNFQSGTTIDAGTGDIDLDMTLMPSNGNRSYLDTTLTGNNIDINSNSYFHFRDNAVINDTTSNAVDVFSFNIEKSITDTEFNDLNFTSLNHLQLAAGKTFTANSDLSLQADGNIYIYGDINSNGNNVSVNAGQAMDGNGWALLYGSGSINTNGGNLTMDGDRSYLYAGSSVFTHGGDVSINSFGTDGIGPENDEVGIYGSIDTNGGNLSTTAAWAVRMADTLNINTGTGDVAINAGTSIVQAGDITADNLTMTANNHFYMQDGDSVITANTISTDVNGYTYIQDDMTDTTYNQFNFTENGGFRVDASKTFNTSADFTLNKEDSIVVYGNINSNGNNLTLNADSDSNAIGDALFYNGASVNSDGGDVSISADRIFLYDGSNTDAQTGNVNLFSNGSVGNDQLYLDGAISAYDISMNSGQLINIYANTNLNALNDINLNVINNGSLNMLSGGSITAGNDLNLSNQGLSNDGIFLSNGSLSAQNYNFSTGDGDISLGIDIYGQNATFSTNGNSNPLTIDANVYMNNMVSLSTNGINSDITTTPGHVITANSLSVSSFVGTPSIQVNVNPLNLNINGVDTNVDNIWVEPSLSTPTDSTVSQLVSLLLQRENSPFSKTLLSSMYQRQNVPEVLLQFSENKFSDFMNVNYQESDIPHVNFVQVDKKTGKVRILNQR